MDRIRVTQSRETLIWKECCGNASRETMEQEEKLMMRRGILWNESKSCHPVADSAGLNRIRANVSRVALI